MEKCGSGRYRLTASLSGAINEDAYINKKLRKLAIHFIE